MGRYVASEISKLALGNGKTLFAAVFFFLAGISGGVFLELIMSPGEKADVAGYLQQYLYATGETAYPNPFFSSAGVNLLLLAIMLLSGLSVFGFPLAFASLTYKGLSLGFSSGLLIDALEWKGICAVFFSMLPQNLLLIPAFLVAATAAANYSLAVFSAKKTRIKKSRRTGSRNYLMLNIILALAILAGCLIEGLLFPIVT